MVLSGGASELLAQPYAPTGSSKILISLFTKEKPLSLILKPQQGGFRVFGGGLMLVELHADELLFVTAAKGKIRIRTIERALGTFSRVLVKAAVDSTTFSLKTVDPTSKNQRVYSGSVAFTPKGSSVESILETDFEKYVAGVVEGEIGPNQVLEMYKVQAIIARTFALSHMEKHSGEKYNLCDDVHCQVFKGISSSNLAIAKGCELTRDLVVVNRSNELITAVFHANCGGQTANSEDVWPKYKSYLRSCPCPYCSKSRSYRWRMGVAVSRWDRYLEDNGVKVTSDFVPQPFEQHSRKAMVELENITLPLAKVRKDLGLRSTFFSYAQVGDSIVFSGKGYGHGVGLCQDGASNMARMNMTCQQIIGYYYKNCIITNRQNATPEREGGKVLEEDSSVSTTASVERQILNGSSRADSTLLYR